MEQLILGYVSVDGVIYPYTDIEENGYLTQDGNVDRWIDKRRCELTEEPKRESYLTPKNEFEKELINACTDLAQTLIKKNRDYGDSFRLLYNEYGDNSTAWRLTDKLNRFKTLLTEENLVKDESKDDTLLDIAGYSILTLATKGLSR